MSSPGRIRLLLTSVLVLAACGDTDNKGGRADADVAETVQDVTFDVPKPDGEDIAEVAQPDTSPTLCATPGGFGCSCNGNGDCLDELCIEGPDGNLCTRSCSAECPDGFDCLNTSLGGPDPISICVPRHTRLCRPCQAQADCQSPLDPAPAACVGRSDPSEGSFCATSCAQSPCPSGYACEDVAVGETTAKLCMPEGGACECRPSWADLALVTGCAVVNSAGTCTGSRTCDATGLTACTAATPLEEVCNLLDEDCDGVTDDIAGVACDNENEHGTCSGVTVCDANGDTICGANIPAVELCNDFDDDCDGDKDESWADCLPAGCNESEGVFIETGEPGCVAGDCVYPNPRPCGLYTCAGGGDAGDLCATSCTDDTTCISAAHCDETTGTCVLDVLDGGACVDASDCASGHCQNGFCCADGDCCKQPDDCPASFRSAPQCEVASTCQGTRRDAKCVDSMCSTSEPIADDSGCTASTLARDCSPNVPKLCTGAVAQTAPECDTTCDADADCVDGYHCDGVCVADVADGGACDEDTDCGGGHCQNGFCCASGDCCSVAANCPDSYRDPATCLDNVTCQGERVDAVCTASKQCDSQIVQDDSGCDVNVEANACGPYRPAYCKGTTQQAPPQCPFSCSDESECDNGFHCDVVCVPDLPNGNFCDEDSDCGSAHCSNNVCCVGGDCCTRPTDCPASYFGPPTCDFPSTCQGTRDAAVCTNFVCGTTSGSPDDSACTAAVVANECGAFPAISCNGAPDQAQPACPTRCDSNSQCDANAFCENNTCKPKKDDGLACTDGAQCGSGHCQNGYCCASGDCCATASNCSLAVYGRPSVCDSVATCQGTRRDPVCVDNICELGETPVPDDSGCAGLEANNCGYFDPVVCTAAANQSAPTCATSCTGSSICDDGANCTGGTCVPNQGVGGPCQTSAQCGGGLTCVDGVCCTSTCTGACQACNIPGNLGICQDLAAGVDPAGECGAVSCTGYYWGFDGKSCYQRAGVAAEAATCGGDGACEGPADLCPSAAKGTATVTCHPDCQVPTANTCQGTTPGQCTNVTGGTQTCGIGACQRTVDRCANGAYTTCVEGAPSTEVCDGIDNDCDGFTDALDPNMVRVACDNQKGVCSGAMKPASLCVNGRWQACTDAIYAAYSNRYQSGAETSCETTASAPGYDNDCDGSVDEDFRYTGPDGTQVQGAGKACGVGVCAGGTTVCSGASLVCTSDTRISGETCDGSDNDCDGKTDSLDGSLALVACENQTGVCQGAMKTASLCASGGWQPCGATQYGANSTAYQSVETLCDGLDNDCVGGVDNNLTAPLNTNQNGACAGTKKRCGGTFGWADDYGSVAGYGLSETPDGNFADENCDGIDGDENLGLFVTPGGSTSSSCTKSAPCNLARAISIASAQKPHIYLGVGSHTGGPFAISKNLKIFGGYNTSWVRKARATVGHESRIYGGAYGTEGHAITLHLSGSGVTVDLADLFVHGVNASGTYNGYGRSSYAVYASGVTLNVDRCDVIAGNGAGGASGNNGTSASQSRAASGTKGGNASRGYDVCSTTRSDGGPGGTNSCSLESSGGAGGQGGRKDSSCPCVFGGCWNATAGLEGANGGVVSGSAGTKGSGGATCSNTGTNANAGWFRDGSGGAGATATKGSLSGGFWYASNGVGGLLGEHGGGGGGGGGSGGCDDGTDSRGAGGGGGGAGGCRASASGAGGYGGGGSFGIFAYQVVLRVQASQFARGTGGAGGAGGGGGQGQPGGLAGDGGDADGNSPTGGRGGAGANGGNSGAGGGGAGGVSFGVFTFQGTLNQSGNTFGTGGGGGSGGSGGTGYSPATNGTSGATGTSANTGTCSAAGGC